MLIEAARTGGLAPSRFARRLLLGALRASAGVMERSEPPTSANQQLPPTKGRQLGVRVPGAVYVALEAAARDHRQTPSGWTAALIAHCLLGHPFQPRDEVLALREATKQLTSVGVLLNQTARALNTQIKSGVAADAQSIPHGLIERCSAEIRSTTDLAHRLIEANQQVYRRSHMEKEHA